MPAATAPSPALPRRRWVRRILLALCGIVLFIVAGITALVFYASSEAGLSLVLQQVERLTDGRLKVTGASGSLLSTFRAQELRWQGPTTTIIARDVFVEWSPSELTRRRLHVTTLGAAQIEAQVAPSASPAQLPASLGLPLTVAIDHASVTLLDWTVGASKGRITGLAFTYNGDATQHKLSSLLLGFEQGHIAGEVALQAARPFTTAGHVAFTGVDALAGVVLDAMVNGPLATLTLTANGRADNAELNALAELTPFAAAPLTRLDLAARDVNAARFLPALPDTALALHAEVRPAGTGFAGTFTITNASPGSLDVKRLPVTSITATFAQGSDAFTLSNLDVMLTGGARATGSGRVALASGNPSTWSLALANVDLHALHGSLAPTRISGRIDANVARDAQRIEGTIADRARALTLAFAARIADDRLELTRAQLGTAAGSLDGRGTLALAGTRAFAFTGHATHFNPAELGRFPAGALDGDVTARGTLSPDVDASVDVALAASSQLAGLPARGTLHASLRAQALSDIALDAKLGDAHVQVHGNAGHAGDVLRYDVVVPELAAVATLLPAQVPRPLRGRLVAQGELRIGGGAPTDSGVVLHATGEKLVVGEVSVQTARFDATIAPASGDPRTRDWNARGATIDAAFTNVAGPLPLTTLTATLAGSLGAHTLTVVGATARDSLSLTVTGSLAGGDLPARAGATPKVAARTDSLRWMGQLSRLDATGLLAIQLTAPATLEASSDRLRIANAALSVDSGRFVIDEFAVTAGKVSTRGQFSGVPLLSLAQLGGITTPISASLKLGGAWSIAATPRLNGTFSIARESGDLYAAEEGNPDAADYALGVTTLAIDGTFSNDALAATGRFESRRAGTASATLAVAAGSTPGRIATDTLAALTLRANLASLAPLQPWLGTSAVIDGHATLDVAATGTLAHPAWSGTFNGDGLRLDSPQWGLQLADGRVRARLDGDVVQLDELTVRGGEGHLSAQGRLARTGTAGDSTEIRWKAEHFRLLNRPDRRIVLAGEGLVGVTGGKLSFTGAIEVEEGHVAYESTAPLLGDDVVIKGRPRPPPADDELRTRLTKLDLDVDLGRKLTFEGEGLETRLAGKVHLSTGADGRLYSKGTIRAVNGTYYAFGQRLSIERGRLIFDGPLDNPALDIVALRRNLAVEAGVEVTGTVKVPRIQLTSNPPVPDGEKLSWLVTGQAPGRGNGADAAALAAASSLLLGGSSKSIGTQVAERFGLDDISLSSAEIAPTSPGGAATTGQVLSVGKRITDRLTLVYEQGLSVATNALRLEYRLSRALTIRAEAGLVSGIGLVFRRDYD